MDHFDLSAIDAVIAEDTNPITAMPSPSRIASKIVANIAAGAVSATVVSLIHQNTTTYNKRQTVQLYVGAYVVGAMVADKAEEYVTAKVQPTFQALQDWLWIPVEDEESLWTPVTTETDPSQDSPTEQ